MKPDELREKLKESASTKMSKTLDSIYDICMEQVQRGLNDFSMATIARLGYNRGVPKAQSLRNKTGQKYQALLRCFQDHYPGEGARPVQKGEDDWIEEIQNPKHKLLVRMQASELAAANSKLRDFIPPGTRIEVKDYQNEGLDGERGLSNLERRALEYLISDEFLDKWTFSITEYGEIVDGSGNVVMRAATIDAVKKALTYL